MRPLVVKPWNNETKPHWDVFDQQKHEHCVANSSACRELSIIRAQRAQHSHQLPPQWTNHFLENRKNLLAACFIVRVGLFIRHLLHPWWIIMEKQSDSIAVFYNAQCTRLLVTLMWVQRLHPYQSRAGIMKVSLEIRLARTQAFSLCFDLCSTWLSFTGWLVLWPFITPK